MEWWDPDPGTSVRLGMCLALELGTLMDSRESRGGRRTHATHTMFRKSQPIKPARGNSVHLPKVYGAAFEGNRKLEERDSGDRGTPPRMQGTPWKDTSNSGPDGECLLHLPTAREKQEEKPRMPFIRPRKFSV